MDYNGKLGIREFSLDQMAGQDPAIVIIAKRGSGKTWVCRSLLDHFRDIPAGIIISRTESKDPFFSSFFPETFIYDDYNPIIFHKILERQVKIMGKAKQKALEGKKIDTRFLLLMDDCLANCKEWSKDENLKEILFDGRHYHITYVLTMQQPMAIAPDLRSNFDYVFLMYTDIISEQKKFYEHYAGMFDSQFQFKNVYEKLTDDHGCMVLKKRNAGKLLTDKIFHYKSSDISPPRFGCRQFQAFHDKNFDKNWTKKKADAIIDPMSLFTKRKPTIRIQKLDVSGHPKFD